VSYLYYEDDATGSTVLNAQADLEAPVDDRKTLIQDVKDKSPGHKAKHKSTSPHKKPKAKPHPTVH